MLPSLLRTKLTATAIPVAAAKPNRCFSSSPYGRTHVWKRRPPVLPNPVVPKFPQLVIRADGSTFTHWITSPRSVINLARDTTSNPVWNTAMWATDSGIEEESVSAGRLGRFTRRFTEIGAVDKDVGWMESFQGDEAGLAGEIVTGSAMNRPQARGKKQKSKRK